eukprot:scaffold160831_cov17-Tisochrysis_lutea.AAC.1
MEHRPPPLQAGPAHVWCRFLLHLHISVPASKTRRVERHESSSQTCMGAHSHAIYKHLQAKGETEGASDSIPESSRAQGREEVQPGAQEHGWPVLQKYDSSVLTDVRVDHVPLCLNLYFTVYCKKLSAREKQEARELRAKKH